MGLTTEKNVLTSLRNFTGNDGIMSNCANELSETSPNLRIFLLVSLSLVLIFSTLFNSFALWVFCCKMKKWTETRVFMMSLLTSDCCLLVVIPFRIYSVWKPWDLGPIICKIALSCYFMNTYMGICIITLIAVDRYIAIKFPLKARSLRSPKKAVLACGIILILLLATCLYLELKPNRITKEQPVCFRKLTRSPLSITLYFAILGFCIPLVILIFCSVEIIKILKKKPIHSTQELKSIQKTIYIVFVNLVIFMVCFLPFATINIVRYIVESLSSDCSLVKLVNDFANGTQAIANINCCLDAVTYYFVAAEFWEKASLSPKLNLLLYTQTQDTSLQDK
ncbi:G-protein coupled receptor 35-like [Pelobates fuscus]|uniref:G-protein coupled receptor 35-like n=1 Tax=Pelobates fuscus TaxID=191477 RepID=UPI002FE47206